MRTTIMCRRNLLNIFTLALLAASAFGQTSGSGTITGTLKDPSGAVVPGAAVTIRNTDTSIDRKTQTTEAGIYTATFLRPGHYEINVSKPGFSSVLRKDLTLQVGQTLTIDFSMGLQTAQELITVNGQAGVVIPRRPRY